MNSIEKNHDIIEQAINNAILGTTVDEVKIKLDIETIDVTELKPYAVKVDTLFNKYEKKVYNLMGNDYMRKLCLRIKNVFENHEDLNSYQYWLKIDKVGFWLPKGKESKKFTKLSITVKIFHEPKSISVEYMLLN